MREPADSPFDFIALPAVGEWSKNARVSELAPSDNRVYRVRFERASDR